MGLKEPIIARRAWCVFEASCTAVSNAQVKIAIADMSSFDELIAALNQDADDETLSKIVEESFGDIFSKGIPFGSVTDCEARDPADEQMILDHIKQGVGISRLDALVKRMFSAQKLTKFVRNLGGSDFLEELDTREMDDFLETL